MREGIYILKANSCCCMAETSTNCKAIFLQLKINLKKIKIKKDLFLPSMFYYILH